MEHVARQVVDFVNPVEFAIDLSDTLLEALAEKAAAEARKRTENRRDERGKPERYGWRGWQR